MLERALRDVHFNPDPKRSAKQQALEVREQEAAAPAGLVNAPRVHCLKPGLSHTHFLCM
jgi:hypothetical protein